MRQAIHCLTRPELARTKYPRIEWHSTNNALDPRGIPSAASTWDDHPVLAEDRSPNARDANPVGSLPEGLFARHDEEGLRGESTDAW